MVISKLTLAVAQTHSIINSIKIGKKIINLDETSKADNNQNVESLNNLNYNINEGDTNGQRNILSNNGQSI